MSEDPAAYRRRADAERALAAASPLDNVRERSIRSAEAWEAMAVRFEKVARSRQERETRAPMEIVAVVGG